MSKLLNSSKVRKPPEGYRNLFGRPALRRPDAPPPPRRRTDGFERYCGQIARWREVARSLQLVDVEAARDAFRMEADRRRSSRSSRSGRVGQ